MRTKGIAFAALTLVAAACGDRPDIYEASIGQPQAFALTDRVVLLDSSGNRAAVLVPRADATLDRSFVSVGKGPVRAEPSPDRKRLFVLSTGDIPRRKSANEPASLTVIEGAGSRRLVLESPHSGIAVDKLGRYVALFAAPVSPTNATNPGVRTAQTDFVENPNEIVIVDLEAREGEAVTPRTIRSFGGKPQRVTFTDPVSLPGGMRRLLIVETDQDVHLLDLDNIRATPRRPEITVRLTSGGSVTAVRPQGIVVDDGDPARNDDTRIGIRVDTSSVYNLTLVPSGVTETDEPGTVPNDFWPELNATDVGGVPGDIVFVRTDVGLRLAAIVPSTRKAVLFDPTTSITTEVELPEAYSKISLITNVVGGEGGTDTALLYGSTAATSPGGVSSSSGGTTPTGFATSGVAFLSLGKAVGQTYRTVEVVSLASPISLVRDVPPPRPELKVLEGSSNAFFVLNLASRTASPLTTVGAAAIHVAPDGQRLWAYSGPQLARVTLDNLHPIPLPLDRPIAAVFDVENVDGGRSLVAINGSGSGGAAVGATVLDALAPDTTRSRSYYALLLEGL